jgi:hypothetical protein
MISAARGIERRSALALFALTLLSAAPAITVIGWIQAGLEESRYLYWPSLWICMLLALVFEDRRALACAFLAVQTAGMLWNVEVYCDMSARIGAIAAQVRSDAGGRAVPLVQYGGVGASPDGVFPFGYDLMVRTQSALPGAAVQTCSAACSGGPPTALVYRWDERTRTLTRLRP